MQQTDNVIELNDTSQNSLGYRIWNVYLIERVTVAHYCVHNYLLFPFLIYFPNILYSRYIPGFEIVILKSKRKIAI